MSFTTEQINTVYRALQDRVIHPEGDFDKQGRWYPTSEEDQGVTAVIRSPSKAYPYSYLVACRSKKHVKAIAENAPELFQQKLNQITAIPVPKPVINDGTKNSHRYDRDSGKVVPQ